MTSNFISKANEFFKLYKNSHHKRTGTDILNISNNIKEKEYTIPKKYINHITRTETYHSHKNSIDNDDSKNINYEEKKRQYFQLLKDMIFSPGENIDVINNNINKNKHTFLKGTVKAKSIDNILLFKSDNNQNYDKENHFNKNLYSNNLNKLNVKNKFEYAPLANRLNNINPPFKFSKNKTLVLDLDETLIHSSLEKNPNFKYDFIFNISINNLSHTIYVLKRPYLDLFLETVNKIYDLIIFTASIPEYANPLLDRLDPLGKIKYRLFRQQCTKTTDGLFIKELNKINKDLKDIIIIDNNPISYKLNKSNGLPILTWHSIQTDNELFKIIPLLKYMSNVDDVRIIINKIVNGYYINYQKVNKLIEKENEINNNINVDNKNENEKTKKYNTIDGNFGYKKNSENGNNFFKIKKENCIRLFEDFNSDNQNINYKNVKNIKNIKKVNIINNSANTIKSKNLNINKSFSSNNKLSLVDKPLKLEMYLQKTETIMNSNDLYSSYLNKMKNKHNNEFSNRSTKYTDRTYFNYTPVSTPDNNICNTTQNRIQNKFQKIHRILLTDKNIDYYSKNDNNRVNFYNPNFINNKKLSINSFLINNNNNNLYKNKNFQKTNKENDESLLQKIRMARNDECSIVNSNNVCSSSQERKYFLMKDISNKIRDSVSTKGRNISKNYYENLINKKILGHI